MLYSLSQQLVRQNLGYYLLYIALRPDYNSRLVSYSYYAKFAEKSDSTVFRYINMNIKQFLKNGRGANIIQSSVLLDDEGADMGCTIIVPGMHDVPEYLSTGRGDYVLRSSGSQYLVALSYSCQGGSEAQCLRQFESSSQGPKHWEESDHIYAFRGREKNLLDSVSPVNYRSHDLAGLVFVLGM